jgi:hypothetical protein
MKIKEIEFQNATCSNVDYQLKTDELGPELASKNRKWTDTDVSLDMTVASSVLN